MRGPLHAAALAALLALAGCSHAAASAAPGHPPDTVRAEAPVWPPAPAAPRARLAAVLPDPDAPPPARPFWKRAIEWITGGSLSDAPGHALERPFGVAVASDGAVLVADPDAGTVFRLRAGLPPEPIPCAASAWSAPMALAWVPPGVLLVADAGLAAVVKLDGEKCTLLARGAFERPTGLAVAGGRVVVADPPRHQLVQLSLDGEVLSRWGSQGSGEGQFAFPTSVAPADGPEGPAFVVTDALNFRVARVGADGRWLSAFGGPGDEGDKFSRPKGIAADADGNVYVSDAQRDLVLVFSADGRYQYAIGGPGDGPGQFALPSGLAVVDRLLYVADSQNRRIQVFELLGGRS